MADLDRLQAALTHSPRYVRVLILAVEGSSPREIGTEMLVWPGGAEGTIGGGAFEWQTMGRARDWLRTLEGKARPAPKLERTALGPRIGQCCGGAVTLSYEVIDAALLAQWQKLPALARKVSKEGAAHMPLAMQRALRHMRSASHPLAPLFSQGWYLEPTSRGQPRPLWIWGAGHVGRALVDVLAPLPDFDLTWIDTHRARFPEQIAPNVTPVWSEQPERLAAHPPIVAQHLIVTYSHNLDLELCHQLLHRGFHGLGLIGSRTKWARFTARLTALGHAQAQIARICCPIGNTALGKHPQAIAIGVAAGLLERERQSGTETAQDDRAADTPRRRSAGRTLAAERPDQGLPRRHRQ